MKNLRKVLAIVLVIALAFSMMAVASAKQVADYSDASSIKYTEAVDLVSGLGIMVGSGDTTFGPTTTMTREMAAKVITYVLLGSTVASSLTATNSSFTDVAVSRWSAPFIQYCANAGIINGVGDGTFNPEASVTGSQMAKLLLAALGYGAKGEFTGANWELNALVKGQALGILNSGVNYTTVATREQVALYVFNALTNCKPVTYNNVTGTYTNTYSYTKIVNSVVVEDTDRNMLGYATYALLKTAANLGYYGATAHKWVAYNTTTPVTVSGTYSEDTVLLKTTSGGASSIGFATVPTSGYYKVGLDTSFVNADTTVGPKYYINGVATDYATANTASGKVGNVVKYIDNNKNGLAEIVYITVYSAAYMAIAPTVDAAGSTTISASAISGTYAKGTIVYPAGMVANEWFSYVQFGANTYIEKATMVTGTITKAFILSPLGTTSYSVTIGDKTYTEVGYTGGSFLDTSAASGTTNFNIPVTAWIDANGYAIYVQATQAASYNYGLVVGYAFNPVSGTNLNASGQVILYTSDGKVATYSLAPDANGIVQPLGFISGDATLVGYTFNAAGQVTLTDVTKEGMGTYNDGTNIVTVTGANAGTYFLNSNTKVYYFDGTYPTNKASVLTGIGSLIDVTNQAVTFVTDPTNSSVINVIYFNQAGPVGSTGNYVYMTSNAYTLRLVDGVPYYDYTGYVNGAVAKTTLTAATPIFNTSFTKGLYSYAVDANGYINTPVKENQSTTNKVTYVDSSLVGYFNGTTNTALTVDSNTKFFQVNNATGAVTAAPMIASVTGGSTTWMVSYTVNTSSTTGAALYVYYIVV